MCCILTGGDTKFVSESCLGSFISDHSIFKCFSWKPYKVHILHNVEQLIKIIPSSTTKQKYDIVQPHSASLRTRPDHNISCFEPFLIIAISVCTEVQERRHSVPAFSPLHETIVQLEKELWMFVVYYFFKRFKAGSIV